MLSMQQFSEFVILKQWFNHIIRQVVLKYAMKSDAFLLLRTCEKKNFSVNGFVCIYSDERLCGWTVYVHSGLLHTLFIL